MAALFNPPPGWPVPPQDWSPPPGWQPDPAWPPAPPGWQFWVQPRRRGRRGLHVLMGLVIGVVAITAMAIAGRMMAPTHTDANLKQLVATFGPACAGHAVRESRAFTGQTPLRLIMLSDEGTSRGDTETSLPDVWTADQIELVLCVTPVVDVKMSSCFYQGSDYTIERYARVVKYQAVIARTGQVIISDEIRALADSCPSSVSSARGGKVMYGNLGHYSTVSEAVEREISARMASEGPSPHWTPTR